MTELPPITHEPHTNCVIYKHDCVNVVVALSICDEGRCRFNNFIERYTAAGMEAAHFPLSPKLQFWNHQDVLRTMAYLKLATFEGRQKSIDWLRARLVGLANGTIRPGEPNP